jgi:putative zinc finger/helix-turn-helix YgiT family protein
MTAGNCPICGCGTLHERKGTYETSFSDRNGDIHELRVPELSWQECDQCKEALLDDAATQRTEAVRRNALGLLTPSEIRELRQRLRKSQSQMSKLLGIGEKTYCRWESGAYVQSTAFDKYLRLLMARPENLELLEMFDSQPSAITLTEAHEPEVVFTHLRDTQRFTEVAEAFTQLLEVGGLHAYSA